MTGIPTNFHELDISPRSEGFPHNNSHVEFLTGIRTKGATTSLIQNNSDTDNCANFVTCLTVKFDDLDKRTIANNEIHCFQHGKSLWWGSEFQLLTQDVG